MTFAPAYSPDLTGIVVLVVDDNADSLDVLSLALERFGATVQTAANARDALAKALAIRPHVIVSDVNMPGMGGVDMVKALRTDPSMADVRILMLTSETSVEAETDGLAAGADDYLLKPVEPRRLGARVKALLARSRPVRAA